MVLCIDMVDVHGQKMEEARGTLSSDVVLESTGPRLYGSVFLEYAPQALPLGTSFVGKWQASSSYSCVCAISSSTPDGSCGDRGSFVY